MAYNKFITTDGLVLLDLTADTVTANKLPKGITAHDRSGTPIIGTAEATSGGYGIIDVETLPTENIDENAVYRTTETIVGEPEVYLVGNEGVTGPLADLLAAQGMPAVVTATLVSELPETMTPAVLGDACIFPLYVLESDGMAYMSTTGSSADAMPFGMVLTGGQSGLDKGWSNDITSETEMGIYCVRGEGYHAVHYWNYRDNAWSEFAPVVNVTALPTENIVHNTCYHITDETSPDANKYFVYQNDDWLEWSKGPGVCEILSDEATGHLKLPEGVTRIAPYACYGRKYDNITLPSTVEYIGDYAFSNIPNLFIHVVNHAALNNMAYEICDRDACICIDNAMIAGSQGEQYTLNSSGTAYMWSAPEDITARPTLYVRNNVKNIPVIISEDAAAYNNFVKSVEISEGITNVSDRAFYYCRGLENIIVPNSVTSFGNYVFEGSSKLSFNEYDNAYYLGNENNPYLVLVKAKSTDITSCEINANTRFIHSGAFYECCSLTSITVPDSIIGIGYRALESCNKLVFNEYDNAYYLGNDNNPYLILVKAKTTDITSCEINANTKIIYCFAFSGCKALTSITIPDGITDIGGYAFSDCTSLTSVTIPNSVTNTWYSIFSNTGLTSVTIPNGMTVIKFEMFAYCSNLASITIPNSVTSIESNAFMYCSKLNSIIFDGTIDQWNTVSLYDEGGGSAVWNYETGNYTIHCIDGDIAKS